MDPFTVAIAQLCLQSDPTDNTLTDDEKTALTCLYVEKTLLKDYKVTGTRTYIKGKLKE